MEVRKNQNTINYDFVEIGGLNILSSKSGIGNINYFFLNVASSSY